MDFRVLGPVEVWHDGRMVATGPRQQRQVLTILAIEAGKLVMPETLVDRIWDEAPTRARHTLHVHLSRIRQLLSDTTGSAIRLLRHSGGYLLDADPDQVDAHAFRRLVAEAGDGRRSPRERAGLLGGALALWRGEPLAGFSGQWAARTRQALQRRYLEAAVRWSEDQLTLGESAAAIDLLAEAASQHPLVEAVAAALMRALAVSGRQTDALDHYTTIRRRLIEELGISPGEELRTTHQAILRGEIPAPSADRAPTPVPEPSATPTPDSATIAASDRTGTPIPAQLPADVPTFTGRTRYLAELDALLPSDGEGWPTAVVIYAVSGTAGVGKTALAAHWAHRVRDRFPDGQLYVNLRGFDPSGAALTPGDAVCGFLDALGVPPPRIPLGIDARVGLYRSLLADKRVLVVLDNARDAEQVRQLLPATATSMAIVTSRNRLTSLTVTAGARPLALDLLSAGEARDLLTRSLGAERVAADQAATDQVIDACAGLPLALAIAAARALDSGFSLTELAAELRDASDRLDALDTGGTEVRAVFSWSYSTLGVEAARLFRLLGPGPGPDIQVMAAASLADRPWRRTRRELAELVRANLLAEPSPGRYTMHDLLRVYATDLASDLDGESELDAARDRLLDYYLRVATAAAQPLTTTQLPAPAPVGSAEDAPFAVTTRERAIDWFTSERPNLVAAVEWAVANGRHRIAIGVPAALHEHLRSRGPWPLALDLHQTAVAAARLASDLPAQANALINLADAQRLSGDYPGAASGLQRALQLYRELRDRLGEANALHTLANVRRLWGEYGGAVVSLERALELYQGLGAHAGEADALNTLADVRRLTGDCSAAAGTSLRALALYERLGDTPGQAKTLHTLSVVLYTTGAHDAAASHAERALALYERLGDTLGRANALHTLSAVRYAQGEYPAAASTSEGALALYQRFHSPLGQANALLTLGMVRHATGDQDAAASCLGAALSVYRAAADPEGEAETLNTIGQLDLSSARTAAARLRFVSALTIARAIGTPSHEARALEGIGVCALRSGRRAEATRYLRRSLDVCLRIDSPRTPLVRAALHAARQ